MLHSKTMKNARKEAMEYGIDVTLTDANLELTPEQRIEQHQIALQMFEELKRAKKLKKL
jgi:hypothetical protein